MTPIPPKINETENYAIQNENVEQSHDVTVHICRMNLLNQLETPPIAAFFMELLRQSNLFFYTNSVSLSSPSPMFIPSNCPLYIRYSQTEIHFHHLIR